MASILEAKRGSLSAAVARKKDKPKSTKKLANLDKKGSISAALSLEPISFAISLLRNNSTETKCPSTGMIRITIDGDLGLVKGARSMFNPNKVYRFRNAFTTTTASDGAGKIDVGVNFQISTAEWGYMAILFDEVVLEMARIHVCSVAPGVPATPATPANRATLLMGSLPSTLSNYTSATLLSAVADAKLVPWLSARPVVLTYRCPSDRPYALTSDPAGVTIPTSIPVGTMGCFSLNVIGEPLTFSTTYYHLMMENIVKLKLRA